LAREAQASVYFTIPFNDYETSHAIEPFAPSPDARFKAMAELSALGVAVGIGIAPVIPGLNDPHIPQLLKRAREAGATEAFINMLRLPGNVAPYFEMRLREKLPTKAERVLNRIREARQGRLNSSEFGARMRGEGEYWKMIERSFRLLCNKLGFNKTDYMTADEPRINTFRRPSPQASLFD
jgi:DNA repair photolyase